MYVLCYDMWRNYAEFWFLGIWGVFLALSRRGIFGKLCREAALGGGSKGKMLRQMTLKFEKSYEVHVEIHDITAFVKKYLYQEKRFGVRLGRWLKLPDRWVRLILYAGMAEGIILYFLGNDPLLCVNRLLAALLSVSAVRIAALVFESDSLWIRAENSLTDYVANTLYPRQHHEYEAEPLQKNGSDKVIAEGAPETNVSDPVHDEPEKPIVLEKEEKKIFQEVLSELLSG